jgi:protein SMG5
VGTSVGVCVQSNECFLVSVEKTLFWLFVAVIDQLDVQKKESIGAREAIRWLESEFRRGNRFALCLLHSTFQ